jgi:uncharacterized protein involved in exopolysaccharide biosynthesis
MQEKIQIQLIDYIQVIKTKSFFILGGTLLVMIMAAVYFWGVASPVYEAKATLLNIQPKYQKIQTGATANALTMVSLKNLLESKELAAEVRKRLGWEKSIKLDDLTRNMEARLLIEEDTNIRKSYAPIIELYADASNGKDAANLANTWAKVFIERYNDLTRKVSEQNYTFLESEFARLDKELKDKQSRLIMYREQMTLSQKRISTLRSMLAGYMGNGGEVQSNLPTSSMVDLMNQTPIVSSDNWSQFNTNSQMKVNIPPSTGMMETDHLIGYEGQLQDTEIKIKELEAQQNTGEKVIAELAAAKAKKKELMAKIKGLNKEVSLLKSTVAQQEMQTAALEREVTALQSKYFLVAKRKEEAELEKSRLDHIIAAQEVDSDDVKIASWAVPPEKKKGPKRVMGTLSAGVAAFIVFIMLAFLLNYLQESNRSRKLA